MQQHATANTESVFADRIRTPDEVVGRSRFASGVDVVGVPGKGRVEIHRHRLNVT